jgi:hypothetical protein
MPSDAVPILVPGPKVQHGVLSLQTAHANEAAYADGRRGFEWRNGGGTEPERASAGYTLAIQHQADFHLTCAAFTSPQQADFQLTLSDFQLT